jgi:hypothetical protein
MDTRAFGVPVSAIMSEGSSFVPPEKSGALRCHRGSLDGSGHITPPVILGLGILSVALTGLGDLTTVDLAGGRDLEATILGLGGLAADLNGPAVIEALIRIGSTPSADDIIMAMMDTPVGSIESTMTLRQTLKVLLAVAAGKTDITDLGGGLATVKFRDVGDSKDVVTADMDQSERKTVVLDKT